MPRSPVWSLLALALFVAAPPRSRAADYDLYYLGGQSNMDGFGTVSDLPDDLQQPMEGIFIFHGNPQADAAPVDGRGLWQTLRPGHGWGFSTDGQTNSYSDRFGVELTFAKALREAHPDRRIAILKYSRGGTSIHAAAAGPFGCWEPDFQAGDGAGRGINQYDHFLAAVRSATSVRDIDGDGEEDRLIPRGILWMQGESDAAYSPEIAAEYEANLKRLMDLVRAALRADDLPVAIGRISDSGQGANGAKIWAHGDVVRQAQADFVEKDAAAALVTSTDDYGYSDPYHYDSRGYVDLGRKFAEALQSVDANGR
ncbi:MAG: hypothetical protein KF774_13900 [Planctomyces sp.]|nr:hypothetical protein [Planctomyces sp.]